MMIGNTFTGSERSAAVAPQHCFFCTLAKPDSLCKIENSWPSGPNISSLRVRCVPDCRGLWPTAIREDPGGRGRGKSPARAARRLRRSRGVSARPAVAPSLVSISPRVDAARCNSDESPSNCGTPRVGSWRRPGARQATSSAPWPGSARVRSTKVSKRPCPASPLRKSTSSPAPGRSCPSGWRNRSARASPMADTPYQTLSAGDRALSPRGGIASEIVCHDRASAMASSVSVGYCR